MATILNQKSEAASTRSDSPLEQDNSHSTTLITIDQKTEIASRDYFSFRLREEVERAQRYQHFVSLMILSVENLTPDDEYIRNLGALLKRTIRQSDLIACLGGNRFAFIFTETPGERVACVAVRLKDHLKFQLAKSTGEVDELRITTKIICYPADVQTEKDLIQQAQLNQAEGGEPE